MGPPSGDENGSFPSRDKMTVGTRRPSRRGDARGAADGAAPFDPPSPRSCLPPGRAGERGPEIASEALGANVEEQPLIGSRVHVDEAYLHAPMIAPRCELASGLDPGQGLARRALREDGTGGSTTNESVQAYVRTSWRVRAGSRPFSRASSSRPAATPALLARCWPRPWPGCLRSHAGFGTTRPLPRSRERCLGRARFRSQEAPRAKRPSFRAEPV
jgi:hypothetical protein